MRDERFNEAMGHNLILMAIGLVLSMSVAFVQAYLLFRGVYAWKWFNVILFVPYINATAACGLGTTSKHSLGRSAISLAVAAAREE